MFKLEEVLSCPRCRAPIQGVSEQAPRCSNLECTYASEGFLSVAGQPVLIDFEESIFGPEAFADGRGSVLPRDYEGTTRTRWRRLISGTNQVAVRKAGEFLERLNSGGGRPRVLVVGGGVLGKGTEALYQSKAIDLVGLDVYASPYTSLVADAHRLPLRNESFDAVWVQAVLEHVLDPQLVVAEIFRVLRAGGLVYAETPFMQQVHEGAYDFTRFTKSGHRWLFRNFEQIDAGAVAGAGTAAIWSLRYLLRALGWERTHLALPFFWLRLLDGWTRSQPNADAASCVYFFGVKSANSLSPKDMVGYYGGRQA
jgi:SAM-dependent methyltransferase